MTLNGNVYSTLTADGLSDTEKASPLPDAIGIYRSLHDAIPSEYAEPTISPLGWCSLSRQAR